MANTNPFMAAYAAPAAPTASAAPAPAIPAPAGPSASEGDSNPFLKLYHESDEKAHQVTAPLDQTIRSAAKQALDWTGQHVGAPVDAVLGAPQRGVAGIATAFHEGHPERALSEAGTAIMHPDQAEPYQEGLRGALHTDALLDPHPSSWLGHARNFAVKTGTEMVTDPLNATPLPWIHRGEQAIGAALHAIPGAAKVGEKIGNVTRPLTSAVDPTRGVGAAIGSEKAGEFAALQGEAKNYAQKWFDAHPDQKRTDPKEQLDLQEKLAQTYLQRVAPERLGFNARHYETKAAAAPQPTKPRITGQEMAAAAREGRQPNVPPVPPGNAERDRLLGLKTQQQALYQPHLTTHGKATMEEQTPGAVSGDIKELLRSDPEAQHLLETWEKTEMPKALAKQVYAKGNPVTQKILGGFPVKVADALKDVMFLNPIPHTKNELFMAAQSPGGTQVIGEGLKLFAQQKTPAWQQLVQHMQGIGATSTWLKEREGLFGKIAAGMGANSGTMLGKITSAPARAMDFWAEQSHDLLWNLDNSLRGAMYLQQKRLGKSDPEIASYINAHMFNYGAQSELAEKLHAAGAPFAHWRIGSPERQARGLVENPAGTERLVRSEQNVNNEIDNPNEKINFATPIDEATRLANPATTLPYIASTMGEEYREPLRLATGKDTIQDVVKDPTHDAAAEFISRMAPGGETALDIADNPFHSKAPAAERYATGLIGAYPQAPPSTFEEYKRFYKAQGKEDFEAQKLALKALSQSRAGLR